jgi:Raf kinase inhibitor-like YbhB/YbcL family protein
MKKKILVTAVLLSIFLLTSCSAISQSQYDNVTAQLAGAQAQIQATVNSNSAAQAAIKAFQAANATVQAQIQALQNANISAQSIIQGLQNDKAAAQAQIQALQTASNAALAQIQALQSANTTNQTLIAALQSVNATAQAQIQALQTQIMALQNAQNAMSGFVLTSNAFNAGDAIPVKYSQQGANISPPLSWTTAPNGTKSFVLLAEDIEGTSIIVHWVMFNIPATVHSLAEGIPVQTQLPDGSIQGLNQGRANGFLGPSPPVGTSHRYEFSLFALDASNLSLNGTPLDSSTNRTAVISAMQGHILGVAQTFGTYKRDQSAQNAAGFVLTSSAFKAGDAIPVKYSQQGANMSPPLAWTAAPNGTQSFVMLAEDIEGASIIVHWVMFNIPATVHSFADGIPIQAQLPDGSIQGNTGAANGYRGPSPPAGTTHRYEFTLFALDQAQLISTNGTTLNSTAIRADVISAMQGHILGVAQTFGKYQRPQ